MSGDVVAIAFAGYFVAAFLKGITGLGFSTICLGLVASFIDIRVAIPLMILPSLASNVLVMVQAGHFREAIRRFWPTYLAALPGIAVGLWLLDSVDGAHARTALGAVLLLYGSWALLQPVMGLSERAARHLGAPVGLLTGVVNGLTGSQVMPVLPYLLALGLSKELMVQAINVSFTLSSVAMLLGLGRLGLVDPPLLATSAAGIVPVAVGIHLGGRIRRRLPESAFRRLVLGLLVVLGAALIIRSW